MDLTVSQVLCGGLRGFASAHDSGRARGLGQTSSGSFCREGGASQSLFFSLDWRVEDERVQENELRDRCHRWVDFFSSS